MQTTFTISEVFQYGWNTMKRHFGILMGISLAIFGIRIFGAFVRAMVCQQLMDTHPHQVETVETILIIFFVVIQLCVGVGWIKLCLKVVDGQKVGLADLTRGLSLVPRYFGALILFCIISMFPFGVILGMLVYVKNLPTPPSGSSILFVTLPLILFAVSFWGFLALLRYSLFGFVLVDKQAGVIQSFQESARLTKGVKGKLLGFFLVSGCLFMISSLPLYIKMASLVVNHNATALIQMRTESYLYALYQIGTVFVMPWFAISFAYLYRRLTPTTTATAGLESKLSF